MTPAPPLTKYEMAKIMAKHLQLPMHHIMPDITQPDDRPGQTQRPLNCGLSTKKLSELGVNTREEKTFDQWWGKYIAETGQKA